MRNRQAKFGAVVILVCLCLLVSAGLFVLNDVYIAIRLKELRVCLQQGNRREVSVDHISLVTKYAVHQRLYNRQMTRDEADALENHVSTLADRRGGFRKIPVSRYRYLAVPVLAVINFNRFLLGKSPVRDLAGDDVIEHLEIAYFYERNNCHRKALDEYRAALARGRIERSLAASILLHQGYCNALLGNFETARDLYRRVIREYPTESIAITASILLRYLEGFRAEFSRVIAGAETDRVARSEKLCHLMAYREALRILDEEEARAAPARLSCIRYQKGLCRQEAGDLQQAINTFTAIIAQDPGSEYARLANRRLYLIGTGLGEGSGVRAFALMINRSAPDPVLDEMIRDNELLAKGDTGESGFVPIEDEKKRFAAALHIAKQLPPRVQTAPVRARQTLVGRKVRVKVNDGNLFVGVVLDDADGRNMKIMTSFGEIGVEKKSILNLEVIR